jgi:hypothetical protein
MITGDKSSIISPLDPNAELANEPEVFGFKKSLPPTFSEDKGLLFSNRIEVDENNNMSKNRISLAIFIRKFQPESDTLHDNTRNQRAHSFSGARHDK